MSGRRPCRLASVLLVAASAGCVGGKDEADGGAGEPRPCAEGAWFRDADEDGYGDAAAPACGAEAPEGYVADDEDCDDGRADVHPGAEERCDGVDDDCDGTVDDDAIDATEWYTDADGDGDGHRPAGPACAQPEGTSARDGDCDDARADVYPGAGEVCDDANVDEDCDGLRDDDDVAPEGTHDVWRDADGDGLGDPDAPGFPRCDDGDGYVSNADDCDDTNPLWPGVRYLDADGDGHGDPATAATFCEVVFGRVAVGDDCDDADPATYPGAPEDDCADPVDHNCDGSVGAEDRDGDGAPACEDCDDGDPGRSRLVDEVCNGVDDDCDGWPDDDPVDGTLWYSDADHDRYGDPAGGQRWCAAPGIGWTLDASDCDDGDADVNPSAPEDCATAVDDDCDGAYDAVDADHCTLAYDDGDGDGYGGAGTCVCVPGDWGLLPVGGDCDDAAPEVNPAAEEACDATTDADCDGYLGCAEPDRIRVLGDAALDAFGLALALAGDQDGDGAPEVLVGADEWVAVTRIAPAPDARGAAALARLYDYGVGHVFGGVIAGGRDLDGDGWDDVYTASVPTGGAGSHYGTGWVVFGPVEPGRIRLDTVEPTVDHVVGPGSTSTVTLAGDLTGDGLPDAVVGAPGADTSVRRGGIVAVLPASTTPGTALGDVPLAVHGSVAGEGIGAAVLAPGDLDGDGLTDLLVGAAGGDAVYLFAWPVDAVLSTDTAAVELGRSALGRPGRALAGAGDIDGDGLPDVLVAFDGGFGVTWAALADLGSSDPDPDAPFLSLGPLAADAVAVGDLDVDGDGRVDLAVGIGSAAGASGGEGLVEVFLGPGPGAWTRADASTHVPGPEADAAFGAALLGVPDPEGDGCDDLLVGAPGYDGGTVDGGELRDSGAAWLLRGCGW